MITLHILGSWLKAAAIIALIAVLAVAGITNPWAVTAVLTGCGIAFLGVTAALFGELRSHWSGNGGYRYNLFKD